MDYRRTLPFYMMGFPQNMEGRTFDGLDFPYNNGNSGMYDTPNYDKMGMNQIPRSERDYFDRYRYPYFTDTMNNMSEEQAMQDLDYLQQMYPDEVKKYQKKIADVLDKIDYRDSLIYDDYPDRLALRQLASQVISGVKQDDDDKDSNKWDYIEDLIYVLLFYEIFRRRHRRR